MGVDREGGYAIPFLTRVGGDHALGGIVSYNPVRTPRSAGITRAGRDRVRLLDSDLVNHSLFRAGREHDILIHVRIAIDHLVPRGQ